MSLKRHILRHIVEQDKLVPVETETVVAEAAAEVTFDETQQPLEDSTHVTEAEADLSSMEEVPTKVKKKSTPKKKSKIKSS